MDAKEYLEARHPALMSIIEAYIPVKVDLVAALNGFHQAKSKEEAEERYKGREVFIEVFNDEGAYDPNEKIFNILHQDGNITWLVKEDDFKKVHIASGKDES